MKIKLMYLALLLVTISNIVSMNIVKQLKDHFLHSAQIPRDSYNEPKREHITINPINPSAQTIEAHTCNAVMQLFTDMYKKKLTIDNIESCQIIIDNKQKASALNKMIKSKFPNLYEKTVITYKQDLPEGTHAILDALIKHSNTPKKAHL